MAEGTRERGDTLRGALAKLADAMLGQQIDALVAYLVASAK